MDWFVYLLECCDGTLYCGITCNLERRLDEHNGILLGGAKYTRSRRPVQLVASVSVDNRSEASKLEYLVKKTPKDRKISVLNELKDDFN